MTINLKTLGCEILEDNIVDKIVLELACKYTIPYGIEHWRAKAKETEKYKSYIESVIKSKMNTIQKVKKYKHQIQDLILDMVVWYEDGSVKVTKNCSIFESDKIPLSNDKVIDISLSFKCD